MYEDIRIAAAARDRAFVRLRQLVAAAVSQDGSNVSAVAVAAGVTRQTAYRWAAEVDLDRDPYADPAAAMDDALLVLLELGAGPTATLTAGMRSNVDPLAKARRVRLGAGNLPGSMHEIGATEEQQAILSAGIRAASDVLA